MSRADLKPVIQELVNLPSRGLIYRKIPKKFSIRPLTVNELKMLYGASNTMHVLDNIIQSVVDVEDFPVEELLAGDRMYLAYMIRAVTFGPEYTVKPYCSVCKDVKTIEFDLTKDIEIDYLPDDFKNPRSIGNLPVCGDEIEIKLLTGKDFERILNRSKEIRNKFPDYQGDPMYPVTLATQISSINGERLTSRDKEEYVLDLHAKDDIYITQKIKEVQCGPKMPIELECPDCGATLYARIELSEDFFRPELEF